MKTLIADSASDARAREAVELFVYQLIKQIGAMIGVLGGLKTLVFTGGIGEHAPSVRTAACKPFEYLGVCLDEDANQRDARVISRPGSSVSVEVMPTDENLMIARHTAAVMKKIP
jgi:acetate kinase